MEVLPCLLKFSGDGDFIKGFVSMTTASGKLNADYVKWPEKEEWLWYSCIVWRDLTACCHRNPGWRISRRYSWFEFLQEPQSKKVTCLSVSCRLGGVQQLCWQRGQHGNVGDSLFAALHTHTRVCKCKQHLFSRQITGGRLAFTWSSSIDVLQIYQAGLLKFCQRSSRGDVHSSRSLDARWTDIETYCIIETYTVHKSLQTSCDHQWLKELPESHSLIHVIADHYFNGPVPVQEVISKPHWDSSTLEGQVLKPFNKDSCSYCGGLLDF